MRVLAWLVGILMALAVLVFGLQIVASETGEVVVLHTGADGGRATTRLWVVDHDGQPWLRAGADAGSGWVERLRAEPRVELERHGERRAYLAHPEPAMTARINALMQAKYGWRDHVVALLAGARDDALPIRLEPVDEQAGPARP